jgi:hypothetical protein
MNKTALRVRTACVSLLLALSGTALADTYMKQVRHTDAFTVMGQKQPAQSETIHIWLGDEGTRIDNPDGTSMLVLVDGQRAYAIKHAERSYAEMPLDMGKAMEEMMAAEAEEDGMDEEDKRAAAAAMQGMAGAMMQFKVSLQETGERQKIGDWNARKYVMTTQMPMGVSTSEIWATEDLKADMAGYWKAANVTMAGQGGFADMLKEMSRIRGVVVKTVSRAQVMGTEVKSTEELVEFAEREAPAATFKIPAGYRQVPMFGD